MEKLLCYDFTIQYKHGPSNKATDALSREFPPHAELSTLPLIVLIGLTSTLKFSKILDQATYSGYSTEDQDMLKLKGRLVLPKGAFVIPTLLHEYHNSPIGEHSRVYKTHQHEKGCGETCSMLQHLSAPKDC